MKNIYTKKSKNKKFGCIMKEWKVNGWKLMHGVWRVTVVEMNFDIKSTMESESIECGEEEPIRDAKMNCKVK